MGLRGRRQTALWIMGLACLAVSLPAAAASPAGLAARADAIRSAAGSTVVTDIQMVRTPDGGVEIRIAADHPLRPRSRRLSNPERFVLDFADAVFGENRTIDVDAGDIKSIRISSLYQQDGRATRVVIDLTAPHQFEVTAAGDILIVKLASAGVAAGNAVLDGAPPFRVSDEKPAAFPAGPERRTLIASRSSAGESGTELLSAGVVPQDALTNLAPQPRTVVAEMGTQPSAISDRPGDNNPAIQIAEPATEKPADSPSDVQLFDTNSSGLGVGVTGRGEDMILGPDPENVLGPRKEDRKHKLPRAEGENSGTLPLRLSGAVIGGYYQADGKGGTDFHEASPVGSVHVDASGYLYHPGFLSFSVRPQGGLGRQSSEGIFPDGQGVTASTTFLGGSAAPLTVSYSRLNRKLVAFGPMSRLAGLEANTSEDSATANWTLRLKRMPEISFNFTQYSDSFEPLAAMASRTTSATRLGSVQMHEKVMGWELESRYKLERSSQDLLNIFDPAQAPNQYKRRDQEARFSADRNFGQRLSFNFQAGAIKSQNILQDRPFDQSYRFVTGNSLFRATKKLTLAFHAGVTNNVLGATLERTTSLTPSPADQPSLLVPTSARLKLANSSVSAEYAVTKNLQLNAEAMRETTTPQQASSMVAPASSLTSAQAGVSWSRRVGFVRFQSHYGANFGNFLYGLAGSSRSSGHKADLGATVGALHSLELTTTLQGAMQDVTGNTVMRDRNWGATLSLARAFGEHWKVQATYNRAYDRYEFLNQQFTSDSNGLSLALSHPRVDFSVAHNIRAGLSFQADPRLQYVSSSQAGMLLGAFPGTMIVPAGADWSSGSLAIRPFGKFHARATWQRSRLQLQGAVDNRYTEWEASAGYQFRSLNFDAGYIFHDQDFGAETFQRNRVFFRAVREFTVF